MSGSSFNLSKLGCALHMGKYISRRNGTSIRMLDRGNQDTIFVFTLWCMKEAGMTHCHIPPVLHTCFHITWLVIWFHSLFINYITANKIPSRI
jgi:hypothetical protein